MSHTPSKDETNNPSPGKPTPSVYPYTVPPSPTNSTLQPLSPPQIVHATILDINCNPVDRTRAPILRRTASGHLFAAPEGRCYTSELPPSVVGHVWDALDVPQTGLPLLSVRKNLPGAVKQQDASPAASKTEGKYVPAPDTPGLFHTAFVFGNGEARVVCTDGSDELKTDRSAPASKVAVEDNLEAFGRRSCVGVVENVLGSGSSEELIESEAREPDQDVWIQIVAEYGSPPCWLARAEFA